MSILLILANVAAAQVACGNTVSSDVTLTADLICSPGFNGTVLTVTGDNVVINGNGFTIDAPSAVRGIFVNGRSNVVIQNVNLALGPSSYGLELNNTTSTSVFLVQAPGTARGIYARGSNPGLVITDSDVSNSTAFGMYLLGVDANLQVVRNTFDGSKEGLRFEDLTGPWTLPSGAFANSFVGVAESSVNDDAIYMADVSDITIADQDLSSLSGLGRGVYMTRGTNVTIRDNDLSGRASGVGTGGASNPGLSITGNDVSDSTAFALNLTNLALPLTIENNILDRSDQGLLIAGFNGPWTFPTSNSFVDVPFDNDNDDVIELQSTTNVVVANLSLPASTYGRGNALRLFNVSDILVDNLDASDRNRGVYNTGFVTDLEIYDSDFSNADVRAVQVSDVQGAFVLQNNTFDGAKNGLLVSNSTGARTIDLTSNTFVGVGGANDREFVEISNSSDITLTGLKAVGLGGTSRVVRVANSSDVSVQGLIACEAFRGVDVANSDRTVVGLGKFGGAASGVFIDANSDLTDVTADVLNNANDVNDNGTNTTVSLGTLVDTDMDGTADVCEVCINDPLNDLDNDGLCADVDPDDDGDGIDDGSDIDPNNPFVCQDLDGDGCDDCSITRMPTPLNDGDDFDGDGLCDLGDPDDDGDGRNDGIDAAPLDDTVCADTDFDGCDDCSVATFNPANDGPDADSDGVCDARDLVVNPAVDFDSSAVSWPGGFTGGVGSPSVVYDSASGLFVMVYETRIGDHPRCPVGVWGLGLATSPDGLNWTDAGGPLIQPAPTASNYYTCVAAHPSVVNRSSGNLTLFFKAEQRDDACSSSTPTWGCGQYTGIGRLALLWSAAQSKYLATPPDSTPALNVGDNFGYIRGLFAGGEYKVALTRKPNMVVASGTASSLALDGTVWSPGDAPWTPDEVYNPAAVCEADGSFTAFLGGRALAPDESVTVGNVGRIASPDFAGWSIGAGPIFSTAVGDNEMRHWDVLRVGAADYLFYFSDQTGPGGSNRVGLAETNSGWSIPNVQSKVCP